LGYTLSPLPTLAVAIDDWLSKARPSDMNISKFEEWL
jgi:hypothetical protein